MLINNFFDNSRNISLETSCWRLNDSQFPDQLIYVFSHLIGSRYSRYKHFSKEVSISGKILYPGRCLLSNSFYVVDFKYMKKEEGYLSHFG